MLKKNTKTTKVTKTATPVAKKNHYAINKHIPNLDRLALVVLFALFAFTVLMNISMMVSAQITLMSATLG